MRQTARQIVYISLLIIFSAVGYSGCDGVEEELIPTPTPTPTPMPTPTPAPFPTPIPANPAFNGTFLGLLSFNQGDDDVQTLATLQTSVGSPLSGILNLLGLSKLIEIFGEAIGNSGVFEGSSDGPCPITEIFGTLDLVNNGESVEVDAEGEDCNGPFTVSGELARTGPVPTPPPGGPTPTPGGPTPTPGGPTPTPGPTPTSGPTPTPTVSPTPTPIPTPPDCDDVPNRMDDDFFEQNAVTYTGDLVPTVCDGGDNDGLPCEDNADCPPDGQCVEGDPIQVVKVLTSDLTPQPQCMIAINTQLMGIAATLTLTGVIEADGVTCTFDDTDTTVVAFGFQIPATIVSGSATLSGGGQVLSLSAIVANVGAPINETVTIPGVGPCDCDSVEPINQGARTQDAQRIHEEKMEELGIEMGN